MTAVEYHSPPNKVEDYQKWVETTTTPRVRELGLIYTGLGLAGESGEAVERIKKIVRDGREPTTDDVTYLKSEFGDILWYISRSLTILGLTFQDIMIDNYVKLEDRRINGKR